MNKPFSITIHVESGFEAAVIVTLAEVVMDGEEANVNETQLVLSLGWLLDQTADFLLSAGMKPTDRAYLLLALTRAQERLNDPGIVDDDDC